MFSLAKEILEVKTKGEDWDWGLLKTCKCCEETIYANAHELCIVADGIETRWTGVVVCGSCKEVLTDTRHS